MNSTDSFERSVRNSSDSVRVNEITWTSDRSCQAGVFLTDRPLLVTIPWSREFNSEFFRRNRAILQIPPKIGRFTEGSREYREFRCLTYSDRWFYGAFAARDVTVSGNFIPHCGYRHRTAPATHTSGFLSHLAWPPRALSHPGQSQEGVVAARRFDDRRARQVGRSKK